MSAYAAVIEDLERRRREIDALLAAMRNLDLPSAQDGQGRAVKNGKRSGNYSEPSMIEQVVDVLRVHGSPARISGLKRLVPGNQHSLASAICNEARHANPRVIRMGYGLYGLPEHANQKTEAA